MATPQARFHAIMASRIFGHAELPNIEQMVHLRHAPNGHVFARSHAPLGTIELTDYICNVTKERGWLITMESPYRVGHEYEWEFALP